ncbi:hypothetical protein Tco_1280211 [Tanacetum coccineum]
MDELESDLRGKKKRPNEEAEALRKGELQQETEKLTVSIPLVLAILTEDSSLSDPTNPEQDDSEIPPLEDIYQNSTDGIFTNSSYDDEGAVADFTNLETVVNVSGHSKSLPIYSAVKENFYDYAEQILQEIHNRGCPISWQNSFLAMQNQTIVATSTKRRISLLMQAVVASLWIQN